MKRGYTTEVGSFNPNGFGLYDMTGNASEWTEDCLSKYAESAADGRAALGPVAKTRSCERVLRGGSINDSPSAVRSAARFPLTAYLRYDINGLRVAQTLGPVQKAGD